MAQTGQQHPKADVGGQRDESKKSDSKPSPGGSDKATADASKKGSTPPAAKG